MNTKRIEASNSWDRFDERRHGPGLVSLVLPLIMIAFVIGMVAGTVLARLLLEMVTKCH